MSTQEQRNQEQFPWEAPLPTGPFWDDITTDHNGESIARTSKQSIFTAEELAALPLDHTLPRLEKFQLLEKIISEKLAGLTKDTQPEKLGDDDYKKWRNGKWSIAVLHLDDLTRCHKELQDMITASTTRKGFPDVGALNMLAFGLKDAGRNAEAETVGRQMLPLLQQHEKLGPDSPQVIGCMRLLMEVVAKQGRKDEAMELNKKGYEVIGELAKGRFKKYEVEEIEEMDMVKGEIPKWSSAAQAEAAA